MCDFLLFFYTKRYKEYLQAIYTTIEILRQLDEEVLTSEKVWAHMFWREKEEHGRQ